MTVNNEDVQPTNVKDIWKGVVTGKFYFGDETFDLNGPYDTIDAAAVALTTYCIYLNTPKAINTTALLPQSTVKYYGG